MPAAPAPERWTIAGFGAGKLVRFAVVGLGATVLYAALATFFAAWDRIGLGPVAASVAAYAVATLFSYLGHKFVTFLSAGAHARELPRFAATAAAGFAIATLIPAVLSGLFGMPAAIPVIAVCIVIPVVNLFVLDRWVFAQPEGKALR